MTIKRQEELTGLLKEIIAKNYKDPKLTMENGDLKMIPNYANYYFLSSFFPLFISAYMIYKTTEAQYLLFGTVLIIAALIFVIGRQLLHYNIVTIKLKEREVLVMPCPVMKFFKKPISIKTSQIIRIEFEADAPLIGYTRKILFLNFRNENHIKLISTDYSATAAELTKLLNQLIRQL